MGLFDKIKPKKSNPVTKPEQKPHTKNDEPFDIEVIKKFRADRKMSMEREYTPTKNKGNPFDIEGQINSTIQQWEQDNRPLTEEELSQSMDRFIDIMDKESSRLQYENEQINKHQAFITKNNEEAMRALEQGNLAKAIECFERNVSALDYSTISYSYLVDIYHLIEDYNNELRICDAAIESLVGSPKRKHYIAKKEEISQRLDGGGFYSDDEELFAIVKREEKFVIKQHLIKNFFSTDEYKTVKELMAKAKKLYLQNHPTNFLINGTTIYSRWWCSLYAESDEILSLLTFVGEAKYLEDNGKYEEAIALYEKGSQIDKQLYPYKDSNPMEKRITVCQNKIRKQQIKDLEAKAKSLEKEDPAKAIELYNELNILNPNLKKYDKRIEVLTKKMD